VHCNNILVYKSQQDANVTDFNIHGSVHRSMNQ